MKRLSLLGLAAVLLVALNSTSAFADNWVLGDWSANINGSTYNPPDLPGSVSTSPAGYPLTGGSALGSFTFTITNPGANYVGIYLNPYDDYGFGDNSTAFASVNGPLPAGVSYQLGWPGVVDATGFSVFDHFAANTLDGSNTVGVPAPPLNVCCEVAMAELFNFMLNPGDIATVNFTLSQNLPIGPYIQVSDPNGDTSVYLTETSSITGSTVPEPASILLLISGAGIAWAKRRMLRRKT